MDPAWLIALACLSASQLVVIAILWSRLRRVAALELALVAARFDAILHESRRAEESLRGELSRVRDEFARSANQLRDEMGSGLRAGFEAIVQRQEGAQRTAEMRLDALRDALAAQFHAFGNSNDQRLSRLRQELSETAAQARGETRAGLAEFQKTTRETLHLATDAQRMQLVDFSQRLEHLTQALTRQLEDIRQKIEQRLDRLQQRNDVHLEQMRKTVDEKLEATLERRLGESFKLVSERLEQVHKGLGEMQAMASSVGDLKRVLTNVKTRGTWGEVQLGALLEQLLTPEQYAVNVAPRPGCAERVEFALRLPGPNPSDAPVWLPIDAKFPQEDYQRLLDATERADAEGVAEAGRALEARVRSQARDIQSRYIEPPSTTDFAILFVPSEGLYAEVLRRPGLAESLQRDFRVVLAGPTTLAALLNSLQMGFRTLAIQQRSSEVWAVLGAVKTEFGKFGDVLGRVKKKLEEASNQIEQTEVRTRAINRRLRAVEELPHPHAARLLPLSELSEDPPRTDATNA